MRTKKEKIEKPKKEKKKPKGYFDNNLMLELMKERNTLIAKIELVLKEDGNSEETNNLITITNEDDLEVDNIKLKLERIENKIGALYIEVAKGMMRRPNFINYPEDQRDDMISDALYCMTKAGAKYDTNYPNPFGYLSQITFHAFIQSIKNMKKRTGVFVNIEHIGNLDGCDEVWE
jgi:hypothetical protein